MNFALLSNNVNVVVYCVYSGGTPYLTCMENLPSLISFFYLQINPPPPLPPPTKCLHAPGCWNTHHVQVAAVGPGRTAADGSLVPMSVTTGDFIKFRDFAGSEVSLQGVDYRVMKIGEVLAKW